jgi:predicted RNA-binding Zn-ribbon protein involved in translation (DUF1610 family)
MSEPKWHEERCANCGARVEHTRTIHRYTCPVCGWDTAGHFLEAEPQFAQHVATEHPPTFACPTCGARAWRFKRVQPDGSFTWTCEPCLTREAEADA